MEELPHELVTQVLLFLADEVDIASAVAVCRTWRDLIEVRTEHHSQAMNPAHSDPG